MRMIFDKLFKKSYDDFNKLLTELIEKKQKRVIVTANPETFIIANTNTELHNHLLKDDVIIVPDGIGVVKAGNILGYDIKERITGVEIVDSLLHILNRHPDKKLYLYGSKKEVMTDMKKYVEVKYSNIIIVGAKDGYNYNENEVFAEIVKTSPDLVLVALGIPRQEELILKNISKMKKGIFVGVGGSFDVLSGHKKRAPKILIKLNLEWLYRISKEPKRIKRFCQNNIKFMFLIKEGKRRKND
ncbi:MAG TPA: WecB/TagA/CpsF family glycosyltransferase [Gallicola sp.]|nr:WecB/TagA/CpsF family glycosyltransferase [Gallicola sp.]